MSSRKRMPLLRLAAAFGLWCTPAVALASAPIGNFDFTLGGKQSIWFDELIADEDFCQRMWEDLEGIEACDVEISVDGRGRISGHLELEATDSSVRLRLGGPLTGSRRGDGRTGASRTTLTIDLVGELTDGNTSIGLEARFKFIGQVAPEGVASGAWQQRFCVEGNGCETRRTPIPSQTLEQGDWRVALEIGDAGGGALAGGARVELADGSECAYDLRGMYDARSDLASLELTPTTPACAGTSIQLRDVRTPNPLPTARSGLPTAPSSNQQVFAFICAGTVTIAASVDASACSWSIFGDDPPLESGSEPSLSVGRMKYKLFGWSAQGFVYSVGNVSTPSFGRREFIWIPKHSTRFTVVSNPTQQDLIQILLYPTPNYPLPP